MRKKTTFILVIIALTITVFNSKVFTYEYGAYAGYTGAPSDATCAVSGCHDSYSLNSSIGTVKISLVDSLGDTVIIYKPGSKYTLAVKVSYTGRSTFGFEATVRRQSNNAAIGTLTPGTGVQFCYGTTNYLTHTYSSNTGSNGRTWVSAWVAPVSGVGNIAFYAAGNAANGNGKKSGDYIYTNKLIITDSTTTAGIEHQSALHLLSAYPNPCSDIIHATYILQEPARVAISIIDLKGRAVRNISNEYYSQGEHEINTSISDISNGVYFLRIESEGVANYYKIIKE